MVIKWVIEGEEVKNEDKDSWIALVVVIRGDCDDLKNNKSQDDKETLLSTLLTSTISNFSFK